MPGSADRRRSSGTRRRACSRRRRCSRRRSGGSARSPGRTRPRAGPARRRSRPASGCRGTAAAWSFPSASTRIAARLLDHVERRPAGRRAPRSRRRASRAAETGERDAVVHRAPRSPTRPRRSAAARERRDGEQPHHEDAGPSASASSSSTRRSSSSLPGSRIASTWSPGLELVEPTAISACPSRMTEMRREPSGSASASTPLPGRRASRRSICTSTISRFSLRSSSRWIRSCSGTSCSTSAMMPERRADRRRDPEQVEVRLVARVVHARDHLRHAVLLARDLADDQVVLVVAGEREHDVGRPRDARALEDVELGRVAALHLVLELVLERARSGRGAARSASPRGRAAAASARRSRRPCRRRRR